MEAKITNYESKYAQSISDIITRNLLEINSKDYGIKAMKEHALNFTPKKIEEYSQTGKIFVALIEEKVVGTLRVDKYWYGNEYDYVFLTIFVLPEIHRMGIGKKLIEEGEKYVKNMNGKSIKIPASVYGHEFYIKMGYKDINGNIPDEDNCIWMNKNI
ncbi:MAG: GNAT family N-acetyltransferase [Bacilli bacterium]|nr:GNAT family N-acetyltransferase [Bacilli bacterium]